MTVGVLNLREAVKKEIKMATQKAIELSTTQSGQRNQNARVFQGIVVEYPSICVYPEYEGKPYFSIKYTENGQEIIGYGTYDPEVLSEYLKEYFMSPAQPECEDTVPRASVEYICQKNTVSTNPYEHKYHDKFIQFMDDPEISDFGRWQHSNGFNTALVAVECDLDKVSSVTSKVVDKELPKKPIEKRIENGDQSQVFDVCPICGSPEIDKEYGDYCPKCGQKIDWDLEAKNDTTEND